MHIEISHEEVLLDTGGGLKRAASFFRDSDEPFLVHNVDVLSTIDFSQMLQFHMRSKCSCNPCRFRTARRRVIFSSTRPNNSAAVARAWTANPSLSVTQEDAGLAFSGIHVLSPRIFSVMQEEGAFSIIPAYLRLADERRLYSGSVRTGTTGATWAAPSRS